MLRTCVGCGGPSLSARCDACMTSRPSGWAWQRLKARILARDRYVCAFCGGNAVTVDHIEQVSAGGGHDPANLRSLCRDCHLDRHHHRRDVVDPRDLDPRRAHEVAARLEAARRLL